VLSLERGLDQLFEHHAPGRYLEELSPARREHVEQVFESRRQNNVDTTEAECLNLDDRLTIVRKLRLQQACGFTRLNDFKRWSEELKALRNHVAHGSGVLDQMIDPVSAIGFIADLRARTVQVWDTADGL
jgi:hypothetical protein